MRVSSLVRDVTIRAKTEGVQQAAAATEQLGRAADATVVSSERLERRALDIGRAYERLQRSLDAAYRESQMFESGQRVLDRALAVGRIEAAEHVRSMELLAAKYSQAEQAARDLAAANDNLTRRAETFRRSIDPMAAAQERFNAAIHEAEDLYTAGALSLEHYRLGVAKATAEMNAAVQARQRLDQSGMQSAQSAFNSQLGVRSDFNTASRAADVQAYGASLDALRAKFVPLAAVQQQYRSTLQEIALASRAGAINEAERAAALQRTKDAFAATVLAMRQTADTGQALTRATGLARHEMVNLGRQAQDVFVSLASGQSPLTVLIQQGTQIADVFMSSQGTLRGFFAQIGQGALNFAGPLGLAATAAMALYSALSLLGERRELENSLSGIGRAAGVTAGELNRIAVDAARAAEITATAARSMAAEFTRTGKIAPDVTTRLITMSKAYALTTQQDLLPASKELAGLFAGDLSRAAEQLNQRFGAFDGITLSAIRRLESMGERGQAQKLIIDAIAASTANAEQKQSAWNRAIDEWISKPWDRLKQGVGNLVVGPDEAEQKLRERLALQRQIAEVEQKEPALRPQLWLAEARARLAVLERELKISDDIAKAEKERVDRNLATARGQSLVDAQPTNRNREQLNANVNNLEHSIAGLRKSYADLSADAGRNSEAIAKNIETQREQALLRDRAMEALRDINRLQQGQTVEEYRAIAAQKLREEFVGRTTVAEQAQLAHRQKLIDLFGTEMSKEERLTQARQAANDVMIRGREASAAMTKASQDGAVAANAEAEAYRRQGVAAGELERLRQQAAREVRGTEFDNDEGRQTRLNELLMESASKARAEIAKVSAEMQGQVAVGQRVVDVARQRQLSEEQIGRLQQQELERQQLIVRLRSAGVGEAEINRVVGEQVALKERELSIEKERAALGMIASQRDSIALLQLEVSLLGRSTEERNRAVAALKAEQALKRQGIDPSSNLGQQYTDGAKVEAGLNATKEQFVDFGKELTTIVGGAFDDLFSNADKGFKGVAENALKSFSRLGTRLIENQILKPILSGQGFNFGSLTAANDNSLTPSTFFKGIEKAFTDGWKWITGNTGAGSSSSTVSGAPAASGSTFGGIAGVGVAGLAGFGMGQQSQSPLMGGIGGALTGLVAGAALGTTWGGPVGAIVGALAGVAGGIMGQQQAAKQRRQQMIQAAMEYQQNWEQIQPDVMRQRSIWRGETEGSLTGSFREARSSFTNAAKTAQLAGDSNAVFAMERDLGTYLDKMAGEFWRSFGDTLRSLDAGSGPNGPFMQARSQIKQVGEALKGFVTDTQTVGANVLMARKASQDYALSLITGETKLTAVQTEMERITGTAAGLQDVLMDLGLSSEVAAGAIQQGVVKAMQNLRQSFTNDLGRKLNDALGRSYINEVSDLFAERSTLRADAGRLGLPTDQVEQYFAAAAQQIVDNARLTGDAFTSLVGMFPELNGQVHAFTGALGSLEDRLAAAAQRAQGYEDRLFAATNDNSTLEGALAEFNRRAARERQEEVTAGGEHILLLERTLAAERAKIVKDFNDQIVEQQRASIDSIQRYLDDLRGGSSSTLSPTDRLREAQASYQRELAMARSGNAESANGVTQYAQALLEASRAYYGSAGGYQDAFRSVNTDLMGLQRLFGGAPTLSASDIPAGAVTAPPAMAAADTRIVDGLAALRSENASQRAEIAALRADLARLVAALIAAEGEGADKVKGAVDRLTNETRLAANRPAA
ncbi:hypothetical protein ASE61_15090 [Bosea sp. Root670]|uniref:phage tail length tape measure family protein n=1 Tax=Bosea sp. Root670 TaxID=1736583 RepID=UPI0007143F9D|nr:phage tail length tape measure family protein [Bosea sp. Root670]KRE02600.1 hypothetical protein ASE61_15090 [Bosea sp. Root670]